MAKKPSEPAELLKWMREHGAQVRIAPGTADELARIGIKPATLLGYEPQEIDGLDAPGAIVVCTPVSKPLLLPDNKIGRCKRIQHRPWIPKGATLMCSGCAMKTAKKHARKKKPWVETTVPASACPYCDYKMDCATGENPDPKPGDISVCINCASPLRFNDDLTLRKLEPGEFAALDFELKTRLHRYMATVRTLDRRSKE